MVSGTKEKLGRIRSPRKLIIIAALLVVGLVAVWELIQYHVFERGDFDMPLAHLLCDVLTDTLRVVSACMFVYARLGLPQ